MSVTYVFVCMHIYIGISPINIFTHVCMGLINVFNYLGTKFLLLLKLRLTTDAYMVEEVLFSGQIFEMKILVDLPVLRSPQWRLVEYCLFSPAAPKFIRIHIF